VPRAVVHRLDAGKSTFDCDLGKEITRDPTGYWVVQEVSRKPKRPNSAPFAAKGFQGPLRPVLALLD